MVIFCENSREETENRLSTCKKGEPSKQGTKYFDSIEKIWASKKINLRKV